MAEVTLQQVLEALGKATPGRFEVDVYGDVTCNGEDVARIATADEHSLHDANAIALAVNWLRANAERLAEMERDAAQWRAVEKRLRATPPIRTVSGKDVYCVMLPDVPRGAGFQAAGDAAIAESGEG